jgi:hypothetical protein
MKPSSTRTSSLAATVAANDSVADESPFQSMPPTLLIVADLGLLKAYKVTATPRGALHLDLRESVVLDEAHRRVVDRVTDLAGRHVAPTQKSWGAPVDDLHRLKLETKRRLLRKIAGHIERLALAHPDCRLWLAADREINHLLTSALRKTLRARIQINLKLDLVHADKKRLIKCFAPRI